MVAVGTPGDKDDKVTDSCVQKGIPRDRVTKGPKPKLPKLRL